MKKHIREMFNKAASRKAAVEEQIIDTNEVLLTHLSQEERISLKQGQWKDLCDFLSEWFWKPDLDALRICLSTYAAHTYLDEEPVWLFVVGVPGSGKTSVALRSVEFLPNTVSVSDLTTKTLASGFGKAGILNMLTNRHDGNGVMLFPDFTTVMSKDFRDLATIAGQLRQVYDGKFDDWKGNKENAVSWKGKVTCLAAVTPAIEQHWALHRNLGERFMYLNWQSGDPIKTAEYAAKQIGNKIYIKSEFRKLVRDYVTLPFDSSSLDLEVEAGIRELAKLVALARTVVRRDSTGKREVVMVDEPELPTRIASGLNMVALGSATLDHRPIVETHDLELSRRIALNTFPRNRYKVIAQLLKQDHYEMDKKLLQEASHVPMASFERTLEDLSLLNIINVSEGIEHIWISLTNMMADAWDKSIVATIDD
jgi:hypothetical protein